jgi:hypothetical protein
MRQTHDPGRFSGECGRDASVRPGYRYRVGLSGRAAARKDRHNEADVTLFRSLLGCALLLGSAGSAVAQEPAGAKLALDKARMDCGAACGLKLTVEPEAIRSIDLNGDGRPDHIVNYDHVTCERRPKIFCGTGGCPLVVVVALSGGRYREVFRQQVLRYEIEPGVGARTILFRLHGTYCGKTGPEPCFRRQRITARPFRFRQP